MDSSLGVIFVSLGIAKIDEESVPKELGYVSLITLDDLRADLLIRTDDFSILFGVELGGEFGGIDQVTEHDRQLPSFRFGWTRGP